MPLILIDGEPIGGYDELWSLDRGGALDALLAPNRLTLRAEPGAAAAEPRLRDRRAAAVARLAAAPVDLELVLHRA